MTNPFRLSDVFPVPAIVRSVLFQPGLPAPPWQEGLVFYDDDEKTFAIYNNEEDVTLEI